MTLLMITVVLALTVWNEVEDISRPPPFACAPTNPNPHRRPQPPSLPLSRPQVEDITLAAIRLWAEHLPAASEQQV